MLKEKYKEDSERFLRDFILYLEKTENSTWCVDVVRSQDGEANCLYGHLSNFCEHKGSDRVDGDFDWFDYFVSTSYCIYPINDGQNENYLQPTPKLRCIAYMKDILSGKELPTWRCMQQEWESYKEDNPNWMDDNIYD